MKKLANTNSQTTASEPNQEENHQECCPVENVESKPDSFSIKAVRFLIPQNFVNQGQLGTVSSNMEWLTLRADFGTGVFYKTPGVWVEGRGNAKFRLWIPETAIAQIEYENPTPKTE